MAQYQVPQFIDVEDKVFGPLTIRQFVYIAAGALVNVILYNIFRMWVLLVLGFPFAVFAFALAFYKYNGVPFPKVFRSMVSYSFSKKLYLWKKKEAKGSVLPEMIDAEQFALRKIEGMATTGHPLFVGAAQQKRETQGLQDLAWKLDIKNIPHK